MDNIFKSISVKLMVLALFALLDYSGARAVSMYQQPSTVAKLPTPQNKLKCECSPCHCRPYCDCTDCCKE